MSVVTNMKNFLIFCMLVLTVDAFVMVVHHKYHKIPCDKPHCVGTKFPPHEHAEDHIHDNDGSIISEYKNTITPIEDCNDNN